MITKGTAHGAEIARQESYGGSVDGGVWLQYYNNNNNHNIIYKL